MANVTFEQALQMARSLSPEEQKRLRRWLADEEGRRASQDSSDKNASFTWRERELRWLRDHEAEYVGQWVALDGHCLISHGPDARMVYEHARSAGVAVPFLVYVESPSEFQWGGWL